MCKFYFLLNLLLETLSFYALIPNYEGTEASAAYEQDKFNDHGAPALPAIVDTGTDIADAGVIDEQTNFH